MNSKIIANRLKQHYFDSIDNGKNRFDMIKADIDNSTSENIIDTLQQHFPNLFENKKPSWDRIQKYFPNENDLKKGNSSYVDYFFDSDMPAVFCYISIFISCPISCFLMSYLEYLNVTKVSIQVTVLIFCIATVHLLIFFFNNRYKQHLWKEHKNTHYIKKAYHALLNKYKKDEQPINPLYDSLLPIIVNKKKYCDDVSYNNHHIIDLIVLDCLLFAYEENISQEEITAICQKLYCLHNDKELIQLHIDQKAAEIKRKIQNNTKFFPVTKIDFYLEQLDTIVVSYGADREYKLEQLNKEIDEYLLNMKLNECLPHTPALHLV